MVREHRERIYRNPNSLRLTGIADDHGTCHGYVTGGAHVLVRAARKTRFVKFVEDGGLARGRIEAVDNKQGVHGTVLVTLTPPGAPEKEEVRQGTVTNGDFRMELGRVRRGWIVQGHYTGNFDAGPCESDALTAR
jgi:hypothetical protein